MATALTDRVWQLELRGVSAYLVEDDVPTLVDAGTPWDERTLREALDEIGIDISEIGRMLLTHYDLDHVGTLAPVAAELDAPVYAGAFDADILTDRRRPPLTNHKGAFQWLAGLLTTHPSLDIETVDDGETIGTFTSYHTPGDTPGHVAYVSAERGVGLLGDLVSESDGTLEASGWAMSYDTSDVRESIVRLSEEAPPFDVACMGHGTPLTTNGSDALATLAQTF